VLETVYVREKGRMESSFMDPYMECFYETYGFYPDDDYSAEKRKWTMEATMEAAYPKNYVYRVRYPEEWYQPTSMYEKGMDRISNWTMLRYSPYKRISHFREHLNRLQFCQFVTIPDRLFRLVKECIDKLPLETNHPLLYLCVKMLLKEQGYSHFNEHIHHLISHSTQKFLDISYDDRHLMCQLFLQLEYVFKSRHSKEQGQGKRKNFFSYYLIVQLVLYLFHYHPVYYLPTLLDDSKRRQYYLFLLNLFSQTPLYQHVITLHFTRKKLCQPCNTHKTLFDGDLTELL
jgi:hypothetical protein